MKTIVKVVIERGADGVYSAYMDTDQFDFGLNGQGVTAPSAKNELLANYKELKDMYAQDGKDIPHLEFEYEYDVDSFLNYYDGLLSKSGMEKITGVNQKQLWHYSSGKRKPSKQTILKIEEGLRKFGEELSQLHLID